MNEQQVEVNADDIIQSLAQQLSQAHVQLAVLEARLKKQASQGASED
jgi:hypothetical protein